MNRVKFIAVLLTVIPIILQAQVTYKNDYFIYGFAAGVNSTTFHDSAFKFSAGANFSSGIYLQYKYGKVLSIKTTHLYAQKKSVMLEPFSKVTNLYFDYIFMPQVMVMDGLALQAGAIYSGYVSNTIRKADGTIIKNPVYAPTSELNLITGVEIRLQKRLNLEMNYQIPLKKYNTSSFQFTLNYILNEEVNPKKSKRSIVRERSAEQIQDLRGGTLLVRLKTAENTIAALDKAGHAEEASIRKEIRERQNREIMEAFRGQYNFSKIAFFYSTDSKKVKERQFNGVFLDDQMQHDPSITIDTTGAVFIGEFDAIEPDTTQYANLKYFDSNKKKMMTEYYGTPSNYSFTSLVIRDQNFIQLRDPFPYYVGSVSETSLGTPEKRVDSIVNYGYKRAVKKMNKRLFRYYSKASR